MHIMCLDQIQPPIYFLSPPSLVFLTHLTSQLHVLRRFNAACIRTDWNHLLEYGEPLKAHLPQACCTHLWM